MRAESPRENRILAVIVLSQFLCTSLWFAGNAVMPELQDFLGLAPQSLSDLTIAVQLGFIIGTLVFAIFTLADKISPSKLFFICALLGASINLLTILPSNGFLSLVSIRFFTGFFLAGIYPVGMKIASDYFNKGLGRSLGFLVGALVLGTAFPHLLAVFSVGLDWNIVIIAVSIAAYIGGFAMLIMVKEGPYRNKMAETNFSAFLSVFKDVKFRSAAFGYFGHMWELYSFWVYVPVIIVLYHNHHQLEFESVSLASFSIIAMGGLGCVVAGNLIKKMKEARIAFLALTISSICCLLFPLAFYYFSYAFFLIFLLIWGFFVVADSPLFSTLVAKYAPAENKGTALTIVNSFGFAITILSIKLLSYLSVVWDIGVLVYVLLASGPILGLYAMKNLFFQSYSSDSTA